MILIIERLSHIFLSRLLDRLKGSKYSIDHPFVNDSIHFFAMQGMGGYSSLFRFSPTIGSLLETVKV